MNLDVDDCTWRAGQVLHLVKIMQSILCEMDFGMADGGHNHNLDHVSALANASEEALKKLVEDIDRLPRDRKGVRNEAA